MKLTAGAANLLIEAIGRSERAKRRSALFDLRVAAMPDGKAYADMMNALDR